MKKTVLFLVAMLLISCFSVHAAAPEFDIDYNSVLNKVEITGTADSGDYVTLEVFRAKNHLDDNGEFSLAKAKSALKAAKYEMSVLVFASQTKAKDGTFAFDVKMTNLLDDTTGVILEEALSEIYAVVIKSGKNDPVVTEYLYIDPTEQAEAFDQLSKMSAAEKATVITHLEDNKYSLGAYVDILADLNQTKAYDAMYAALTEKKFDVSNESAATAYLQKAIVVEALNQEKLDNVEDYEDELEFTTGILKDWYAEEFVDTDVKADLTDRLEGKGFATLESFEAAALEALVLEYVQKNDGLQYVTDILAEFDEDLWGKDYTFESAAVRECLGEDYSSADALLKAIESYKAPDGDDDDDDYKKPTSSRGPSLSGLTGTTPAPVTPVTPQPQNKFSDVGADHWAHEAIEYLASNNVLAGKSGGIFAPDDNVTRAEFAKILVTAFGFDTKADIAFDDVSEDSWYSEFVKTAVGSGIAKGTSEATFGPEENITRQDMAVMLMNAARIAGKMTESEGELTFPDQAEIADYAKTAVNTLSKAGIINGMGDGSFAPKAFASRAQAAKLVHGLLTY